MISVNRRLNVIAYVVCVGALLGGATVDGLVGGAQENDADKVAGPPNAEEMTARRVRAEAKDKAKIEAYLADLKTRDAAVGQREAARWAELKMAPLDMENDFLCDSLAERYRAFGDALDLLESGAYTNAARRLGDLLAGAEGQDEYLAAHARYWLARIKFSEGDWAGAANDLKAVLDNDAGRLTLEHEAAYYRARALANIAPKEERQAVAQLFAEFLEKYPHSKQRYLSGAADLAKEVGKTLAVVRSKGLTNVSGGPEELPNLAKDLRNLEKRLSLRDTGKTTQELQQEVLSYLDNLIDKAEQQQNQQQQQQQQQQDQDQQEQQKQQGQEAQQEPQDGQENQPQGKNDPQQKDGQAKKDSQLPARGGRGKADRLRDLEALRRGQFGTLPPDEVQKILMEALKRGKIPPKYAEALERYDQDLAPRVQPKK